MATPLLAILALGILYWWMTKRSKRARQSAFIDSYRFPHKVTEELKKRHPHLNEAHIKLVHQGLRDYFHVCNRAGDKMVSMPSQVVDDAWHEFILFTKKYETFCQQGLGRFLHHTPAEAMRTPTLAQTGIKRAWQHACAKDGIDPKSPTVLPLLFGIDAMLNIENGFYYTLNCKNSDHTGGGSGGYCAGDIGCGGGNSSCGGGGSSGDAGGSGCGGCGGG